MIAGIGVDLVNCERMTRLHVKFGKKLETRLLAPAEQAQLPTTTTARTRRLAMNFAAKEALSKALGTGIKAPTTYQQIAVIRNEHGVPKFQFGNELAKLVHQRGIGTAHLSLTDDNALAVAVAILETPN